jgi:hypothetical protein
MHVLLLTFAFSVMCRWRATGCCSVFLCISRVGGDLAIGLFFSSSFLVIVIIIAAIVFNTLSSVICGKRIVGACTPAARSHILS